MSLRTALIAAALLLGGCAHRAGLEQELDDGLGFAARQDRLAALTDWALSGQLIVDTGERRERMRLRWEQRGDRLSLTIRGVVLGAGNILIEGDADALEITVRGETRVLTDPEIDLSREVGWWLPVTSLEHWLLGAPDPEYPGRLNRGAAGVVADQAQRQWRIAYDEYGLAAGLLMPGRITMEHESLELRLSISEFSAPTSQP